MAQGVSFAIAAYVVGLPAQSDEHPGVIGDYVGAYDFDVKIAFDRAKFARGDPVIRHWVHARLSGDQAGTA
jgi:hypothetical protein